MTQTKKLLCAEQGFPWRRRSGSHCDFLSAYHQFPCLVSVTLAGRRYCHTACPMAHALLRKLRPHTKHQILPGWFMPRLKPVPHHRAQFGQMSSSPCWSCSPHKTTAMMLLCRPASNLPGAKYDHDDRTDVFMCIHTLTMLSTVGTSTYELISQPSFAVFGPHDVGGPLKHMLA